MFTPRIFAMSNREEQHQFMQTYDFALLVSNNLSATHLPLHLSADEGEFGVLYGHVARANAQWKQLEGAEVLCVFNGPHGYISPSWYQQSPAVPTWNYASVHAHGKASLLSGEQTIGTLEQLMSQYEPELLTDKSIVTNEYRDKLLSGIVGFEIVISGIKGTAKLSQNKLPEEQVEIINRLKQDSHPDSQSLAAYMQSKLAPSK